LENLNQLLKRGNFSNKDLFKCTLGLNQVEIEVLYYLIENHASETLEIAQNLKKDRSTIQRALQNLINLKLILREPISIKELNKKSKKNNRKSGYLYLYDTIDKKQIKKRFNTLLEEWYSQMKRFIQNFKVD